MPEIDKLYACIWCATEDQKEGLMWYYDGEKKTNLVTVNPEEFRNVIIPIADDMSREEKREYLIVVFKKLHVLNKSKLKEARK